MLSNEERDLVVAYCQEQVQQGAVKQDTIIATLHAHGCYIIDTILIIRALYGISLKDSKEIVEAHPCWREFARGQEPFRDQMEKILTLDAYSERKPGVRYAVGAIVKHKDMYLLVHKVKIMEAAGGPVAIPGVWDFPKGGIKPEESELQALTRELEEETGLQGYRLVDRFSEKICFSFPQVMTNSYEKQETTMFLLEYPGATPSLQAQGDEIDQAAFFSAEDVLQRLQFPESLAFFRKHIYA